ncbi:MAG: tetratricopeptide repeat protein [Acidobacteriota bacterium]
MNSPSARIRGFVLGFTFVLVALAYPLSALGKDNWTIVRSKNFTLVGNASEKEIRQVATRLEQFRDVFKRLLKDARFETPVPTTVIVFKSMGSYKPFNLGNNAGYFQKGEDVNYITLTTEAGGENPLSVIYHEYVHLLVDNNLDNVPAWFNEGLAEYYRTFDIEEDRKVHLGELIPYHLQTLREDKFLPLRTLLAVDHYSPYYNESSKRGTFYAESWALVHYLMMGNNSQRKPQLSRYLELVGANMPIEQAFKQSFGVEIEGLEKELKKYVEGHTFKMQIATFEHKLEFDKDFTAAPLTEAEAQGYLGDLLLHTHRLAEAETRLQQALTLDPKLTMARSSLGIVRMRQGRFAEARESLQAAVKDDSTNYLVHFYYAYALSREGMDSNEFVREYPADRVATMRAELRRAIELNPGFPESYSLLAFVNLISGDGLDESVELLKKAQTLSPGRADLSFMLAQIYLRQQKFDLVRQLLEPLVKDKDRRMQSQAQSLLASMKSYEDSLNRYKSETGREPQLQRQSDPIAKREPAEPEMSPSDYLREALRPVEDGEERIQGLFIKLDCERSGTAYFVIQVGDRTYRIRATSLERVQLIAYTPDAGAEVACGPRKNQDNVILTFRPSKEARDLKDKIDGDAIAVELVPKDFKLKK